MKRIKWNDKKICEFWNFLSSINTEYFADSTIDELLRYIEKYIQKEATVLDIGFGSATLLKHLSKKGHECYGIDVYVNAKMKKDLKKKGVIVSKGSITNINFGNKKFDIIFAFEVLEHLSDKDLEKGIEEVYKYLKKGGYFIATTPYKENLREGEIMCPECKTVFHKVQHMQSFDEKKIKKVLKKYTIEKCAPKPIITISNVGKGIKAFRLIKPFLRKYLESKKTGNLILVARKT